MVHFPHATEVAEIQRKMKVQQLCSDLYYKEMFLTAAELDGEGLSCISCFVCFMLDRLQS